MHGEKSFNQGGGGGIEVAGWEDEGEKSRVWKGREGEGCQAVGCDERVYGRKLKYRDRAIRSVRIDTIFFF